MTYHPLPDFLGVAVPVYIREIKAQGGPTDADYAEVRAFAPILAAQGDTLLFGGKPGEAGELATKTAHAIAVLAFSPGGVTVFGQTWEARDRIASGMYYTPASILRIIDPASGSGAWLADLASNPPYGDGDV